MQFEFDQNKSHSNKEKHGIDFVEGQAIWHSEAVTFPLGREGERRKAVVGTIDEEIWSAIITMRGEKIRIISIRKARKNEKEKYNNERTG